MSLKIINIFTNATEAIIMNLKLLLLVYFWLCVNTLIWMKVEKCLKKNIKI